MTVAHAQTHTLDVPLGNGLVAGLIELILEKSSNARACTIFHISYSRNNKLLPKALFRCVRPIHLRRIAHSWTRLAIPDRPPPHQVYSGIGRTFLPSVRPALTAPVAAAFPVIVQILRLFYGWVDVPLLK